MRHVWKDILIMMNTAGITGIAFYGYHADYNAAMILSFMIFIFVMLVYLLLKKIRRQRPGRDY